MKTGILALQGGFEAHGKKLTQLSAPWKYVRTLEDLEDIHSIILPGGESSVLLKLLKEQGLFEALKIALKAGMPFFGTCAGAILLAKEVMPNQLSFGAVDVSILRNAYGRQLASHIGHGKCVLSSEPLEMFFIRAPRFEKLGQDVSIIAEYDGYPVCVQQGNCLLATFHPELTHEVVLHQYFLNMKK